MSFRQAFGRNPDFNYLKRLDPRQKPSGMTIILQEPHPYRKKEKGAFFVMMVVTGESWIDIVKQPTLHIFPKYRDINHAAIFIVHVGQRSNHETSLDSIGYGV